MTIFSHSLCVDALCMIAMILISVRMELEPSGATGVGRDLIGQTSAREKITEHVIMLQCGAG